MAFSVAVFVNILNAAGSTGSQKRLRRRKNSAGARFQIVGRHRCSLGRKGTVLRDNEKIETDAFSPSA
jgi:hypothetical protein